MKKRFGILSVALVMMLLITACGGATTGGSSVTTSAGNSQSGANASNAAKPTVAYFVGITSGGAAWGAAEKGFNDACAELGWEGYFLAPTVANDTTQMVNLAETAITNGADVLLGTFYSAEIFGDVAQKAREKGAYVVTTNCAMNEELQNFWIGTEPLSMGVAQAKTLVELAGDKEVSVVYIQTTATAETQNQQYAAFSKYLADYNNITVFGQEFCDSDPVVASDKLSALIKANPKINAVICADSYGAVGIANYVDESGKKDDFISVGIDDSEEILSFVKSGAMDCTIAQNFYNMGYSGITMVKDIIDGKTVSFDNDSGSIVIMADDVDAYAAEKGYNVK